MGNKVLIIDDRPQISELLSENLRAYVNSETTTVEDLEKALSFLKAQENFQLIICRNQIKDEKVGSTISLFLSSHSQKIPLIVLGAKDEIEREDIPHIHNLKEPFDIKDLIQTSGSYLSITAKEMANLKVQQYWPVSINFFIPGVIINQNIFQKNPDGSYIKLFSKGMKITFEAKQLLNTTHTQEVYVQSSDRLSIVNDLTTQTIELLEDKSISVSQKSKNTENVQNLIFNLASDLGVQEATVKLADTAIDSMIEVCQEDDSLTKLMNRVLNNKHGFMYQHCLLSTYFSYHLLSLSPYATEEQMKLLAFIAFFHDISLVDPDHHSYQTDEEVEASNLPADDKRKILDHAALSASIVNKFSGIPFGVGTLIKQHHGNKSGRSISKLSQVLSPIAAIFVVSESWAEIVIEADSKGEKISKEQIIHSLHTKLPLRHFEKIIQLINKTSV